MSEDYDFPQDNLEFHQAWSACAARKTAFEGASNLASSDAMEAWYADKFDASEALKSLAKRLRALALTEEKKQDAFIKEADRRRR